MLKEQTAFVAPLTPSLRDISHNFGTLFKWSEYRQGHRVIEELFGLSLCPQVRLFFGHKGLKSKQNVNL
jgi:hypothetical protein